MALDPISVRDRLRAIIDDAGRDLAAAAVGLHEEPLSLTPATIAVLVDESAPGAPVTMRMALVELAAAVVASDPYELLVSMGAHAPPDCRSLDDLDALHRRRLEEIVPRLDAGRIPFRHRNAAHDAHRQGLVVERCVEALAVELRADDRVQGLSEADVRDLAADLLDRLVWTGGTLAMSLPDPPERWWEPPGPPRRLLAPSRDDPTPYSPRDLAVSVDFAHRSLRALSEDVAAVWSIHPDDHPSALAQVDQVMCSGQVPNVDWALRTRERLWLAALPAALSARRARLGLDDQDVAELLAAAARFAATLDHAGPEERGAFAQEVTRLIGHACARDLAPRVEAQVELAHERIAAPAPPSGERLAGAIGCALANVLLMSLDSPATGAPASVVAYTAAKAGRFPSLLPAGTVPRADVDVSGLAQQLRAIADQADAHGLDALGATATALEGLLATTPTERLESLDGQWSMRVIACRECAMPNAALTAAGLDPTLPGLCGPGHHRVVFPLGLNRVTCCFCGCEQTVNVPAVFHVPGRGAIVYCLPWPDPGQVDLAADRFRDEIERVRRRYAETLTEPERAAYWATPGIMTTNWERFMTVAQMGETVPEAHEFNVIGPLADGSFVISDPAKGFERHVTPWEAQELDLAEWGR